MQMTITDNVNNLRASIASLRGTGGRIAFVPTMGALHRGHMALVEEARKHADAVVVSIFVNPLQFGANEDLGRYPRTPEADQALLAEAGVEVLYIPTTAGMYPEGFATNIHVKELGERWCGAMRPGHFDGVATVVAKLLMQVAPDVAVFGEKDFQQLAVIRRMARDMDIPVEIIGAPTIREEDGLALSSRNRYLSEAQRAIAPILYAILQETATALSQESGLVIPLLQQGESKLLAAGFTKVDYYALVHTETLQPLAKMQSPARVLAAAWLGQTRLIDNISVG